MRLFISSFIALVLTTAMSCSGEPTVMMARPSGIPWSTEVPYQKHELDVRQLAVSPDGTVLATISADRVSLWRTADSGFIASIEDVERLEFAQAVEVSNGGHHVAVLNEFYSLHLWDDTTHASREVGMAYGQGPTALVGFIDEVLLWVSSDGALVAWTVEDSHFATGARDIDNVGVVEGVGRAPDNQFVLWGARPEWVSVDAQGGLRVDSVDSFRSYDQLIDAPTPLNARWIFYPERAEVVAFDTLNDQSRELTSEGPRATSGAKDFISALTLSTDGRWLAAAHASGAVEVWDSEERTLVGSFLVGERYVRAVFPRKVLDLRFGGGSLWVLLPEQTLLQVDPSDWTVVGRFEL